MAGAYELPIIGDGKKAAQAWIYPVLPAQADLFTPPIWVQDHHLINLGMRTGADAQDMLTAMSMDPTAHGKWFDYQGFICLQRMMPEETEEYHWRDVDFWTVLVGQELEQVFANPTESCYYRFGVRAAQYVDGQCIVRIGTS